MGNIETKDLFCRPVDERMLLAFCLHSIDNYFSVRSKLEPIDFLYPQHEMLMYIFKSLVDKGANKFDVELINSEAQANDVLDNIGGLKYINALSKMGVDPDNFDIHLTSVVEASVKYKLYNLLSEKQSEIANNPKEGKSSVDLLNSVEVGVMDLTTDNANIDEPVNLSDGIREYVEEKRNNKIDLSGLTTGYPIFDKQIDGLIPGTLHVVAARRKKGKSALLTNIGLHSAFIEKKPVLYIDTEMNNTEWRDRALAILSGVKEREVRHGCYSQMNYEKLQKAIRIIESGKIFHEYMPGYTVEKITSLYKKYKIKEDIGLMVFDYLKEPDSSSIEKQRKEYQILGDVTTRLKDLAGRLNIPALTAVQLNRDNDIADSDRIARYADIVCYWGDRTKEEIEDGGLVCGTHKLVIKDTRRGGSTSNSGIGFNFLKEWITIREVKNENQFFTNFEATVNQNEDGFYCEEGYEGYDDEELI